MNETLIAEIETLKAQSAWHKLESLYAQLSHNTDELKQRLFYDWERALLLAGVLDQPLAAIQVLVEAELAGGPTDLIAQKIGEP